MVTPPRPISDTRLVAVQQLHELLQQLLPMRLEPLQILLMEGQVILSLLL